MYTILVVFKKNSNILLDNNADLINKGVHSYFKKSKSNFLKLLKFMADKSPNIIEFNTNNFITFPVKINEKKKIKYNYFLYWNSDRKGYIFKPFPNQYRKSVNIIPNTNYKGKYNILILWISKKNMIVYIRIMN